MTDPKYMRPGLEFATGKLVEELGELQAALGKSMKWGFEGYNPELPVDQRELNVDWVLREIKDVQEAIGNFQRELARKWPSRSIQVNPTPQSISISTLQFALSLSDKLETTVTIDYTNWRGERYTRQITPKSICWGSNSWHPEPQFLMTAWCHKSQAKKCFAIKNIHSWREG